MRPATQTVAATTRPRTVAAVLLDRRATVYLPEVAETTPRDAVPDPVVAAGVVLLEADLLERGFLMSLVLREHLVRLDSATLATHGAALLADLDRILGADRPMVPLFRGFPRSVPANTETLWVDRVLTLLFQHPEQPCVLCGTAGRVNAVSPCAHLVCSVCFDGADYSACPICYRRIDPADPFLQPSEPRRRGRELVLPARARVLSVGSDSTAAATAEVTALLARTAALSPQDSDDLLALLPVLGRAELSWLPASIEARETKALVLAWLLAEPAAWPQVLPVVASQLETATDALRLLAVRGEGDAGLTGVPRFAPVPRPLRRTILARLNQLDPRVVAEDLRRHRLMWIHAAERLHPFEHAKAYPQAAAAFAVLRETPLREDALGDRLRVTAASAGMVVGLAVGSRLTSPTFGARVERALSTRDTATALRVLASRPGELIRRLDHLLRLASAAPEEDAVVAAARLAAPRAATAVLLGALGELRVRAQAHERRVFFPKGTAARAHAVADHRPPLAPPVVAAAVEALTGELLARAGRLPAAEVAVVDQALFNLIAPFTQRTASRALVTLPRGSVVHIEPGQYLRLFLQWMELSARVDLDLSAAFFGADWEHLGTCDYTSLRWAENAAIHSGDLTSAPPPLGAAEFLDLDLAAVANQGARYVVAVVFSYNSVPFDQMAEAFAGIMVRAEWPELGPTFDARAVEQRFDLASESKASVPFLLDLSTRELRWLDVTQKVTGTDHAVHRHRHRLARLGEALHGLYGSGARVNLGELAVWHAAGRARTVLMRAADGAVRRYDRGTQSPSAFAAQILGGTGEPTAVPSEPADLAYVYRADLPVRPGGQAYALYPAGLDADEVQVLAAADLVSLLAPVDESGAERR